MFTKTLRSIIYNFSSNHYLHKTHPLSSSASMFLTIRRQVLVICLLGSTPATLPAATAFSLCSTNRSFSKMLRQNLQYQSPRGTLVRDAHSAQTLNYDINISMKWSFRRVINGRDAR